MGSFYKICQQNHTYASLLRDDGMKLILQEYDWDWLGVAYGGDIAVTAAKAAQDADGVPMEHNCGGDAPNNTNTYDFLFNITSDPLEQINLLEKQRYHKIAIEMKEQVMRHVKLEAKALWKDMSDNGIDTWIDNGYFISPWENDDDDDFNDGDYEITPEL